MVASPVRLRSKVILQCVGHVFVCGLLNPPASKPPRANVSDAFRCHLSAGCVIGSALPR